MKNIYQPFFNDFREFEIECILNDKEGNPICFLRRENFAFTQPHLGYYQKKTNQHIHNIALLKSITNHLLKATNHLKKSIDLNTYFLCDHILLSNLLPGKESENFPGREFEEPIEPDMNPETQFPDQDIDYPKQDEILDDEPMREIKEPNEKEFDSPEILPNEEENFPGVFPKNNQNNHSLILK